jgi:ASC-1-like (ASCH) protein
MKNGKKTIEGRLNKTWRQKVEVGDHIIIKNDNETEEFETVVIGVRRYKTFQDLLEKEALGLVLPGTKSVEEGIRIYRQFYSREKEKELGVVAIEVKVL